MNRVKQKAWQAGMRHLILSHGVPGTSRSENKSPTKLRGRREGQWCLKSKALNEQTADSAVGIITEVPSP